MREAKTNPNPNPLFSKNIPPPPPAETKTEETYPSPDLAPPQTQKRGKKQAQATIELSLYLRPEQDEKLEELRLAYRRRAGRKISANEVMRRLIDRASLDDLLP